MPSEALPLQLEKGDGRKLEPGTVVIGVITIDGHDMHIEVMVGNDRSLTARDHLLQVWQQLYHSKPTSSADRVEVSEIIPFSGQPGEIPKRTYWKHSQQSEISEADRARRVLLGTFSLWPVTRKK